LGKAETLECEGEGSSKHRWLLGGSTDVLISDCCFGFWIWLKNKGMKILGIPLADADGQ
jgi:hypothetical protein